MSLTETPKTIFAAPKGHGMTNFLPELLAALLAEDWEQSETTEMDDSDSEQDSDDDEQDDFQYPEPTGFLGMLSRMKTSDVIWDPLSPEGQEKLDELLADKSD